MSQMSISVVFSGNKLNKNFKLLVKRIIPVDGKISKIN